MIVLFDGLCQHVLDALTAGLGSPADDCETGQLGQLAKPADFAELCLSR